VILVDSHCHLNLLDLTEYNGDLDKVLAHADSCDVKKLLCVNTDFSQLPQLIAYTERYPNIVLSAGMHPNEQPGVIPSVEEIVEYASHPKIVAIGETGLDYFRSEGDLSWQWQRFKNHIEAAKQLNKALIVHTRNAKEDTLRILQECNAQEVGGVLHCFTEDWAFAQGVLALNFYISFSGIVTFKSAPAIQEVARLAPLDKILVETDSPYLAPIPYRGKQNLPGYVRNVAQFVADLRQISLEEIAKVTTENFERMFMRY